MLRNQQLRQEIKAANEELMAKETQLGLMRIALRDMLEMWDRRDKSQWTAHDIETIQRAREAAR